MLEKKCGQKLLLLMDGHALVHRAWHAIQQPLSISSTGEDVRAVYGFLNSFFKSVKEWQPTHCAIAFDLPGPTFRHKSFPNYKAHRPPMPPELRPQFEHVRHMMNVFKIPIFDMESYEADDILGTLCLQASNLGVKTLVLTGDTDTLQTVSPLVNVVFSYGAQNKIVYDESAVRDRYGGLGPGSVADIKALEGDKSDNIPGVPRIGLKTAIRLLQEFNDIEGIYQNIDNVEPIKIRQSLITNRDLAFQGKSLATIVTNVPVGLDLEQARFWQYDRSEVVGELGRLEFFSIVSRLPEPPFTDSTDTQANSLSVDDHTETQYQLVLNEDDLVNLVERLKLSKLFAFRFEVFYPKPMESELIGLSFSDSNTCAWYVPVDKNQDGQLSVDNVLGKLRSVFEDETVSKVAHNANFHITILARRGIFLKNLVFDTEIGAHVIGKKALGVHELALELLNKELTSDSTLIGSGRNQISMAEVPLEKIAKYSTSIVDAIFLIYSILSDKVNEIGVKSVLETIELPLIPVLVRMQSNGTFVDVDLLEDMSAELATVKSSIEAAVYDLVGHEFNLNSSQQLSGILFNELRLPATKRTKKGYSTDASSLEWLKQVISYGQSDVDPKSIEILDDILEYRQISKIKSTYVDALPTLVNKNTGRIHTVYNQTGSTTGRVSSNNPNVQNIPVKTELGRKVRKAFTVEKSSDWVLASVDYSQIELRILAHISGDFGLLKAFHERQDIHTATASLVYGVNSEDVTLDMRRIAKVMNFGTIYGLSPFGVSQQTGLSPDKGKEFIETYFGKYPGIKDYIELTKKQVKQNGYVQTLMGRRRYIPEVNSSNFHLRASGERMAINMPIQGTAADIVKIAMVKIQERLDALQMSAMMTIQVHDELIFELPKNEIDQLHEMVIDIMPSVMELDIPLDIEMKFGSNWGEME